jgi:hypothetical protein
MPARVKQRDGLSGEWIDCRLSVRFGGVAAPAGKSEIARIVSARRDFGTT